MLIIEGVPFASISKKTPLSKLSFAFVSLALPLLVHITRVLSAGGTVRITEVIVLSTVGTVHIANNTYPRSRRYHTHHKVLSLGGTSQK